MSHVDNEMILRTMRAMAWERAKGEVEAVLETYWGNYDEDSEFRKLDAAFKAFVKEAEDNGWVD